MEKYKDLILSLIRENKKYTADCEDILNEILSDVYAHAEGILSTVTNESIVKSYLEKAITTSIITVSRKMGVKTGHRRESDEENAKIEEILKQTAPVANYAETVNEPQETETEASELVEEFEETEAEETEPEQELEDIEDNEILEEISEPDEEAVEELSEIEEESEPDEEAVEELSEIEEEPEPEEEESEENELQETDDDLEPTETPEYVDLDEELEPIEEQPEEELLNIDENIEELDATESETISDAEELVIDETEEYPESIPEVDKTLVDRMINGVPPLEEIEKEIESPEIDELQELSPADDLLEATSETIDFDIDADSLPETDFANEEELQEFDKTDSPEEPQSADEPVLEADEPILEEYGTDSLIDSAGISDNSDLLDNMIDSDIDELVSFGDDDLLSNDLSGDLDLAEITPEIPPEVTEEITEDLKKGPEPIEKQAVSYECFSFEPQKRDLEYQETIDEINRLQSRYEEKPITKVFNLKYKENLSVKDIASKLEISEDEVLDILDNLIHIVEE